MKTVGKRIVSDHYFGVGRVDKSQTNKVKIEIHLQVNKATMINFTSSPVPATFR